MNKYIIIAALIIVILGSGIVYRSFLLPEEMTPVVTGNVREITMVAPKNQWTFDPEVIEVEKGDKVILTLINSDDYDHGIAIDAFGIAQRMPANRTITVEFIATQAGEFPFFCSVPCGEGIINGEKRSHFDMIGTLRVKDIANKTP
ncbi:cupredoxin domain-containing protein [Patescibacteria group bacterium AH-259-L05]|nr:cupredoxin domain-containing protein [Patescibacteria group bacterium AH-259-L05]